MIHGRSLVNTFNRYDSSFVICIYTESTLGVQMICDKGGPVIAEKITIDYIHRVMTHIEVYSVPGTPYTMIHTHYFLKQLGPLSWGSASWFPWGGAMPGHGPGHL